ncbi:MAG: hypothetical protein CM15mV141_240 [uncultured marine virus]|nr:MAG: hypothetical protein CM15mV141_240 [uncultured marine virus]
MQKHELIKLCPIKTTEYKLRIDLGAVIVSFQVLINGVAYEAQRKKKIYYRPSGKWESSEKGIQIYDEKTSNTGTDGTFYSF